MNQKVDKFFEKAKKWQPEMNRLRSIVLSCGLNEELKWYQPCYTFDNNNVVIISGFKDYCLLGFFKGALLKDNENILIRPGDHTQSGRQMRFSGLTEINEREANIKSYIYEAIEVEKAGLKVELKQTKDYPMPDELKTKLETMPEFKSAFESLTPGRQRAYILHFSAPKQSKTRESRIEKSVDRILEGKGLND